MEDIKETICINTKPKYISKVGVNTNPIKLATSIQLSLMGGKDVELLSMGKDACYNVSKAICISQGFAIVNGLELRWRPSYKTVYGDVDGQPRSVMSWLVWIDTIAS